MWNEKHVHVSTVSETPPWELWEHGSLWCEAFLFFVFCFFDDDFGWTKFKANSGWESQMFLLSGQWLSVLG